MARFDVDDSDDFRREPDDSLSPAAQEAPHAYMGIERIKLDLQTPLEQFFLGSAAISAIFLFFAIVNGSELGFLRAPLIIVLVLSLLCYKKTDNYYVVDLRRRALMYHFQLFDWTRESIFAPFSTLTAISATGIEKTSKHSRWWEYATVVCLHNGSLIPVSDYEREKFFEADQRARDLGKIIKVDYIPGRPQHMAKAVPAPGGKMTIILTPKTTPWLLIISILLLMAGFVLAGVLIGN